MSALRGCKRSLVGRDVTQRQGGIPLFFFFFFSIWAGECLNEREGREKARSAGRCKDGRATNAVRRRDPGRKEGAGGELPKPDPGGGLLREQLCPGKRRLAAPPRCVQAPFCVGLNGCWDRKRG